MPVTITVERLVGGIIDVIVARAVRLEWDGTGDDSNRILGVGSS